MRLEKKRGSPGKSGIAGLRAAELVGEIDVTSDEVTSVIIELETPSVVESGLVVKRISTALENESI